jgi:choline dehydrogenase-like flavoprotein
MPRCQRKIVAGVTISRIPARRSMGSGSASRTMHARSGLVSSLGRGATKEVIVSAGAINNPQLLMLSGIGPADHLGEHGITTIVDNPNVGDHYMDHPMYMINMETAVKGHWTRPSRPSGCWPT